MVKTDGALILIGDSSGLVSLLAPADRNHAPAVAASDRFVARDGAVIVPGEVFCETLNVLGKRFSHALALEAAEALGRAPFLVVTTEKPVVQTALARFRR